MKNIHVLPTDKPSRLFVDIDDNKLKITQPLSGEYMMNQNIYITSDEEIKEGDWCVDTYKLKNNHNPIFKWSDKFKVDAKKIILTTDIDLIKDGVQAIDDKFLEWFVKNPSCEFVKIVDDIECLPMPNIHIHKRIYKIIIPQEEPKQMSKPTVVQYLIEVLRVNAGIRVSKQFQEEVLQMEKQMIIDAYLAGYSATKNQGDSEQYYNENYKKEEK